ncbi:hypothetical protein H634G_08573 [Metarhizium anisopliae BRIP 53293]|uniref:Uncharacterized protein n=1 Tax=Metarhizium anisopliae BRIP 53293 TaxID=1291518 RepID=A0A0D9NQ48_METAN|nr:hypothetical protein H634G_08573 [Metarhizium anisopliae BRIP 53293]KJK90978.1 hypothetical protein H633G_05147 [Metarhizium anisopliae BRIP 53284]
MNYSKVFPRFVSRLIFPTLLASTFLLLAFNADVLYLSRWQKHARYAISGGIHASFRRDFGEGVQVKYTKEWLQKQFTNPQGIASILLLIGGDIIQKAIAQLACNAPPSVPYFTPVIFTYGWVSYAFISVANAFGSADYFPKPDSPATVVTVASGDRRENQSWVIAVAGVALLLMIGGSTEDSWFLLLVGAIGTSEAHGIPLKRLRGHWEFWGKNMIGTLLRLEKTLPGAGYVLRPLFFTGPETELDYNACTTAEVNIIHGMEEMPRALPKAT